MSCARTGRGGVAGPGHVGRDGERTESGIIAVGAIKRRTDVYGKRIRGNRSAPFAHTRAETAAGPAADLEFRKSAS